MWATWLRVLMVPLVLGLFYWHDPLAGKIACWLFVAASVTDYYDGYWARKYGSVSTMGKLLDPIADKILVSSVMIMLIPSGKIGAMMAVIILGRDTIVGGVRSVAAAQNQVISASWTGKWKTGLQMGGLPCLLYDDVFLGLPAPQIGQWLMWGSVILSIISCFEYFFEFRKVSKL